MAVAAKRSVMTLFSGRNDLYSHMVRIVLAEKGVGVEIHPVDPDNLPEDLLGVNPEGTLPTLVDRELALFNAHIIAEYLDERFPHPPLMPVYPVARAQCRLTTHRIEHGWYQLVETIGKGSSVEAEKARLQLKEELLALAPLFAETPYFMSEEFGLLDCLIAPLLWRMPALGIDLTGRGSKEIRGYMARIFERDSFQASLTETERELHAAH